MRVTKVSSGTEFEGLVGYSRAVRTGPYVVVAGTTGAGPDVAAQTRDALRRIESALHHVGATLADVIRTRIFVTDIGQWRAVGAVHAEVFGDIRPVATMVEVSALISPELMVEIEVGRLPRVRQRGEHPVGSRRIGCDSNHSRRRQRPVQVREAHRRGVRRHPGFPPDRRAEKVRVQVQQYQISAPRVEPVGRQMHLLNARKVDEPDIGQ